MPELPEVEVTRAALSPALVGRCVLSVRIHFPRLRWEIPKQLPSVLQGTYLQGIHRRGKYLLFEFGSKQQAGGRVGWLLVHLGMSGSLQIVHDSVPLQKHEHFEILFLDEPQSSKALALRLRDPRRFGVVDWIDGTQQDEQGKPVHKLLSRLGVEPLQAEFDGDYLFKMSRSRSTAIKTLLMDARILVGVGNIYASESLFRAKVSPLRLAKNLKKSEADRLVQCIQATLKDAIAAGGSSLRDFVHSDGNKGYFQIDCAVYAKAGQPCKICQQPIVQIRQVGRSTFYCANCQH